MVQVQWYSKQHTKLVVCWVLQWGQMAAARMRSAFRAGGSSEPASIMSVAAGRHTIQMNGRTVFKFATRVIADAARQATQAAGLNLDAIDWIVPHQANQRIITAAARSLNLPDNRFIVNLERVANTSAASVPIALAEALESGQAQPHQTFLLVAFGAGLTWAAAVVQPQPIRADKPLQTADDVIPHPSGYKQSCSAENVTS